MPGVRGNGGPRGLPGFVPVRSSQTPQDDLFLGNALDAKWTLVGSPAPSVSGGAVTMSMAQSRMIQQTVTVPTNASLYCRISSITSYHGMCGPYFLDNAGSGVAASHYDSPSNMYTWTITTNAYSATGQPTTIVAPDSWIKLRKAGTNYYVSAATHDSTKSYLNQSYGAESTALPITNTMTKIGIGAFFSNSETVVVEEFRYVPS